MLLSHILAGLTAPGQGRRSPSDRAVRTGTAGRRTGPDTVARPVT